MFGSAEIQSYEVSEEGTKLQLFIPGACLMNDIESKNIHTCSIWLDDGRHISSQQRKKIYATVADIATHTGYMPEEQKELLKYRHMIMSDCEYFSLGNCTMDRAREFINSIMDYALSEGVILNDFGINRTDDADRYLYQCIKYRKCAVCGRKGEIHHVDTIGMGNDRRQVDDSLYKKICLCRGHHTEAHSLGMPSFSDKYKVYGIIFK